ncbi:MAG: hypothetical protein CMD78_01295 [Gammaproteobacteria bacterium]|nr:hypothetical protein [Gammaproteobacteria bacterium]|tara:strand:- start:1481 stop:2170 length:690 start_codon:yes stop_codon:yes gene_type:complete
MRPLWLLDSIGSRLIRDEQDAFADLAIASLDNYFLQLGIWGHDNTFTKINPIKNCFLISSDLLSEIDLVADLNCLPLQDKTIDVVFLPHTLEQFDNQLEILSSCVNAINESGSLVALGFNPISLWGLRHWCSGKNFLPCVQRLISPYQYSRWLVQLGLRMEKIHYFHAIMPLRKRYELSLSHKAINPFLCACYMIIARKEIIPLTLNGQYIKGKKEVGSLADSMSRIRV